MPPDLLLGPVAALALALVGGGVLWRDHLRADADERAASARELAYRETLRLETLADQRKLEARIDRLTAAVKEATHVAARATKLSERVVTNGG